MAEQTEASLPGSLAVPHRATPRHRPVAEPVAVAREEPAVTAPGLLLLMIVCLLIPGNFNLAGAQVSPNRLLLLALFPFLAWRWLTGAAGRPNAVDILVLLCTLWVGLALTVNHGVGTLPRSVMICIEIFGGYLVGRMLIRNTADYRRFFVLLTCGFVLLLPFAVVELLTGKNLIRPLFDPIFSIPPRQSNLGARLGMVRSQTIFEHPILFGLVGSMGVANMLYIYRDKFVRSVQLAAFFVFMVFTTISSGPMLSVGLQLAMTAWDRFLWFLRGKWLILAGGAILALIVVRLASQFHLLDFIIQNFMFNPQTADGRLVILEYGSAEVRRHPIFGIGLSDWVRPWYKKPSVDNFWLGHAMRFGLPSFLFLAAALAVSFSRIAMQSTLSRREASYRTGYLITLAGLTITLGTVYIWSATIVFVTIYIGAGAMFYMRDAEASSDVPARARRAAQARAFGAAAAPGYVPAAGPERQFSRPAGVGANRGRIRVDGGSVRTGRRKAAGDQETTGMFDTYRKLLQLLTRRERRSFYLLLVLIVLMGLVETVGVASIMPFMYMLSDPAILERHPILSQVYAAMNFADARGFMIFFGAAVFAIVVGGLLFKAVTLYAVYRFTMMRGYSLSSRMLRGYLFQPYTWFLNRHSADIGANVLGDVAKVTTKSLLPAMKLITYSTVVIGLVLLLVLVRPMVALIAAGLFGGSYLLVYFGVRKYLNRIGAERHEANVARYRVTGEAVGGIKDVKLRGLETHFLHRFQQPARQVAASDAASTILGELPRYVLEAVAFGGLLTFVLVLLVTNSSSVASIVPMLAVYAFASIRIFPALQRIYGSMAQMRFSKPTLDNLHRDMKAAEANMRSLPPRAPGAVVHLQHRLVLDDIHYAYPGADRPALRGMSLEIPARSTVGIVGGTGAGKTTTVDIILGLLMPETGTLTVDGVPVTATNMRAWQRSIGYVPQQIFLTDDTVSANIAFGREPAEIDQAAVERAARTAELHDFVMREMPQGYATFVGERGVRLSGGQRQRIGIARALYHDPDVLILDEATSALDNLTERAVMDAVHNLGHAKTIVMIAHRLSTVRDCDVIFMLEHGRVVASGSYDDLLENNRQFRALAGA